MNSTINSLTFGAKINNLTNVKNKEAFSKVICEFEKRTNQYPDEILHITRNKTGADSWHITDRKRGDYFKGEEIFTNSIDEHIEELGIKQFAKELVNALKEMKLERTIYKKVKPVKIEYDKTVGLSEAYKNIAKNFQKDNNNVMAKRYYNLSERFTPKIQQLKTEYDAYTEKFNSKIKEYSKDFPEIGQVELYIS